MMPKLTLNMEKYEFCDEKGNTLFEAPLLEVGYLIGSTQSELPSELLLQEKFSKVAEVLSQQYKIDPPLPWSAAMQLTRQVEAEIESVKKKAATQTAPSLADTKDYIPNLGASAEELAS